jgi:hypothetical protein
MENENEKTTVSYTGLDFRNGPAPHILVALWSAFPKDGFRFWFGNARRMTLASGEEVDLAVSAVTVPTDG